MTRIRLRAVAAQEPVVEIVGEGFTPHQAVKVDYDIVADGAPERHQSGADTLATDAAGRFVDRIAVNLGGTLIGAEAQATDLASDAVATASI